VPSRRALGLGLDLVVPGAETGRFGDFAGLAALVGAAEGAGYGSVWLRGVSGDGIGVDSVPVVSALVERTNSIGLGVACAGGSGRHPAILARDLMTLDVLSGGRAALNLGLPTSGADAAARLTEAAQICRLLFSADQAVMFTGEHFSVHFALNRPSPERPDGPPLVIDLPAEADAALDGLVSVADAVVVGGPPGAVSEARARVDQRARSVGVAGTGLVWRGALPPSAGEQAELMEAVTAAGAGSVIVRLGEGGTPTEHEVTDAAARILPVLARAA